MNARTLDQVAAILSPKALSYKLRRDGTLSVINAAGQHATFPPKLVRETAQEIYKRKRKKRVTVVKHPVQRPAKRPSPVKDEGRFVCPMCGRVFRTSKGLEIHKYYCKR